MATIPSGYTFVAPRGRERARQILDIAESASIDVNQISTTNGGYVVPTRLAKLLEAQDAHDASSKKGSGSRGEGNSESASDGDSGADGEESPAPRQSAPKADWLSYAQEVHGYDPGEDLTKEQLIERYGA